MQIDFSQELIIQKTHAVLMLSIHHLIYVCLKKNFLGIKFFVYIRSQHNRNYCEYTKIMSFMECMILVIVYMLLLMHYFITPHALHYMSILFHRGISYTDIFVF